VRRRLDEIWAACAARDFDLLESFPGYGPKFTSFKDGALRSGADANAADERRFFSMLEENSVDMADLAINVFADVAVVTFNGRYRGVLGGNPVSADQQTTIVLVSDDGAWKDRARAHVSDRIASGALNPRRSTQRRPDRPAASRSYTFDSAVTAWKGAENAPMPRGMDGLAFRSLGAEMGLLKVCHPLGRRRDLPPAGPPPVPWTRTARNRVRALPTLGRSGAAGRVDLRLSVCE
jgi:hypothetical protein